LGRRTESAITVEESGKMGGSGIEPAAMDLHVDTIDWMSWQPTEYANLCFVIREGRILLIRKKRGLGAGKINGPGGRLEKGETALASAIRETQEEIGVTPLGLEQAGELFFQFLDGYKLHVAVFSARDCVGNLIETDEATPFWTDLSKIPYAEMWQDDPHWLPLVISGTKFRGLFVFEGERLLSYKITV
jgi:8-oxo-dGTP diphosphatase